LNIASGHRAVSPQIFKLFSDPFFKSNGPNAQQNIRGWALTLQHAATIHTGNSGQQSCGDGEQYHRRTEVSTVPPGKLHIS